jgi:predicted nucleic acid-binding Zn ribbon protein
MAEDYPICLQCGKRITKGRPDKKFCHDGCKNLYHNKEKIREHQEIKKVDLMLKRNRRILKRLFNPRKEEVAISRETLLKQGFDFNFHTHSVITKKYKNEFTFCYDFGYREIEKDKYRIIKSF